MERFCKRVLVPIDLGATCIPALHYAAIFARRFDADVTLMYADELSSLFSDYNPAGIEERLRAFAAEHAPEIEKPETIVVPEHPVTAIVRAIPRTGSDLVIMGTHGRRGWRRALAGSVADGVVRAASRPVLVVPEHRHQSKPERITRVICPVNFTDAARGAAASAAALAAAFDAELILVHVAENDINAPDAAAIHDYFESWVTDDMRSHSSFREIVLRGGAAERVLDCVEDLGADLLVVGAQVKWLRSESVIGTTSERLLRFAPVPVLTVTRAPVEAPREHPVIEEASHE
ncbi:MAG TPA: universal stress protein [Thermoanaerobaculia bacterium]|nr:universal stress protein [Thermoanaerobaculia bacterium]